MLKPVIISDIHGNHDALRALPEEYDELWVLGDLVNHGRQPKEVVADVMKKASLVVQGNHDRDSKPLGLRNAASAAGMPNDARTMPGRWLEGTHRQRSSVRHLD